MTTQTAAPKAAIDHVLDPLRGARTWGGTFRTFDRFADAVREAAALEVGATDEELRHLDEILQAAKDSRGTLPLRMSYAAHLAYHAADDPVAR